jgi:hypothetical protein
VNFTKFKDSGFFKMGCDRYNVTNGLYERGAACKFDTSDITSPRSSAAFESQIFGMGIHNVVSPEHEKTYVNVRLPPMAHLKRVLEVRHDEFLSEDIRAEIIRQWSEVNTLLDIVKPSKDTIVESIMAVQRPGAYIPNHNHTNVVTTLTFCYCFGDSLTNDIDAIRVAPYELPNNHITYNYPNVDKFYLIMDTNNYHDSSSSKWRFFWINDFFEPITVPKFNGWHFLEFNKS